MCAIPDGHAEPAEEALPPASPVDLEIHDPSRELWMVLLVMLVLMILGGALDVISDTSHDKSAPMGLLAGLGVGLLLVLVVYLMGARQRFRRAW